MANKNPNPHIRERADLNYDEADKQKAAAEQNMAKQSMHMSKKDKKDITSDDQNDKDIRDENFSLKEYGEDDKSERPEDIDDESLEVDEEVVENPVDSDSFESEGDEDDLRNSLSKE